MSSGRGGRGSRGGKSGSRRRGKGGGGASNGGNNNNSSTGGGGGRLVTITNDGKQLKKKKSSRSKRGGGGSNSNSSGGGQRQVAVSALGNAVRGDGGSNNNNNYNSSNHNSRQHHRQRVSRAVTAPAHHHQKGGRKSSSSSTSNHSNSNSSGGAPGINRSVSSGAVLSAASSPSFNLSSLSSGRGSSSGSTWGDRMDESDKITSAAQRTRAMASSSVGAAAKQIATLQAENKRLSALLKASNAQKTSLDAALKSEQKKHAATKSKLAEGDVLFKAMEKAQLNSGKTRAKLETEREKLRRELAKTKKELDALKAQKSGGAGGAGSSDNQKQNDLEIEDLKHQLEEKDVALEMAQVNLEMLQIEFEAEKEIRKKIEEERSSAHQSELGVQTEIVDAAEAVSQTDAVISAEADVQTDAPCETPVGEEAKADAIPVSPIADETATPEEDLAPSLDDESSSVCDETPWLFCASNVSHESLLRELRYQKEETLSIDASNWLGRDGLGESLVLCGALDSVPPPASEIFWSSLLSSLTDKLSNDASFLFIIDVPSPASDVVDELVRSFVTVVAEAYERASEPGQVLMVLNGFPVAEMPTVDVTLSGYAKENECFDVVTWEEWKQKS